MGAASLRTGECETGPWTFAQPVQHEITPVPLTSICECVFSLVFPLFSPFIGFKGNLSLLDFFLFFPESMAKGSSAGFT